MITPDDLLKLLKGKYSSLSVTFNEEHAPEYKLAIEWPEYMTDDGDDRFRAEWVSEDERQKAIRENSVWVIHWYPDTPNGFYAVAASTFQAAAEFILSEFGGEAAE